jgi:glycosyltransferase involved in cell wall biosynthesis
METMPKKRVLYDSQIFDILAFGGIPRYYTEIIKGIIKSNDFSPTMGANFMKNKELENHFKFSILNSIINLFNLRRFGRISNRLSQQNEKKTIELLSSGQFDIFHPAFYNPNYLPHLGKTKLVITIYDMIPELYADKSGYKKMAENKAALIRRADQIITISENTKKDLLQLFPEIDERRVTPILLGCNIQSTANNYKANTDKDYYLYVGSREGYKNFEFLIEALSGVLNENTLLYTSGSPYTVKEQKLMDDAGISAYVHRKFVNDSDLADLYSGAKALLFPSEYEGFGLPIIEAFKNNCPVVLTSCSCFPEIAGNAGIYFENKNIASFRTAIQSLDDKTIVQEKLAAGKKRLSLFSWENNIKATEKIYTLALK